jgi:hypothetical protein
LPGIISALAKTGKHQDAIYAATHGHYFQDYIEQWVYTFLSSQKLKPIPQTEYGVKIRLPENYQIPKDASQSFKMSLMTNIAAREILCELFLKAMEAQDEIQLAKFSKVVKFFKKNPPWIDSTRFEILCAKSRLERNGEKWTIGQLAKHLNRPISESQNGYATLNRIAKELNFPLRSRN